MTVNVETVQFLINNEELNFCTLIKQSNDYMYVNVQQIAINIQKKQSEAKYGTRKIFGGKYSQKDMAPSFIQTIRKLTY